MEPDAITAEVVHEALRRVRQARRLDESPLLHLEALRARLRAEGQADSSEARETLLERYLAEVVWEQLSELRGADSAAARRALTVERELAHAGEDFEAACTDLEAWSTLHLRYLARSRLSVEHIAGHLAVSRPTLMRRSTRGYELLAVALREREATAGPAARHNIPRPLTRFIGREGEIAQVRSLMAKHRLVTLTGVGGIGKSRLAMELALAFARDYADGAWMVELGAVESESHVVAAVAAVFGVREQPRRNLVDLLTDFFEAKHLLLILDNCEHLTQTCGDLTQTLLEHCPDLQVLATSRERLRIGGECVWTVPSLSVPEIEAAAPPRPCELVHYDGARLFVDRAMTVLPGFVLTAGNAPHVAEICAALHGIPLATELAAARVKVMSLQELAAQLATPFELRRDGRRPTRPEQETLQATMDWSHELLSEEEQVLFRRLSVFRGGWTLDAAEAVCVGERTEESDVLDAMQGLVDKSLVDVRAHGRGRRHRMLEPVRQYAAE
ncbi:MAG: ATP-binding protein, partial [Anaerolineae bacterium]